jgi:arabinofuranosyltransferase
MDDGFIFFRVVDQLVHGNGPVFNAGERIEAATSPMWVGILAIARVLLPDSIALEHISLWLTLAASVFGLAAAGMGSAKLTRAASRRGAGAVMVPFGSLVVVAIAAFWDYSTAGLETALVFAWLGGSFWALVGYAHADAANARTRWSLAVLLGLGPLIRPDLALYSCALVVALVLLDDGWSWRRSVGVVAVALALPIAYQVFRMGYYGALVPNAALTKDASSADWGRGLDYASEFVRSYALWWPLLGLAAAYTWLLNGLRRQRRRDLRIVAPLLAAASGHTLYVIRVGGDFMHGRLLLPALFAICAPVAVLAVDRAALLPGVAALGIWAVYCGVIYRPIGGHFVGDQRAFYVSESGRRNPVTLEDFDDFYWRRYAERARDYIQSGERIAYIPGVGASREQIERGLLPTPERVLPLKRALDARAGVAFPAIGVVGYAAGRDVFVLDRLGLADPIGSRIPSRHEEMVGHQKPLSMSWIETRLAAPSVDEDNPLRGFATAAGRRASTCGALARLLRDIGDPLTPGRFFGNVKDAVANTRLRIPNDPVAAADEFC